MGLKLIEFVRDNAMKRIATTYLGDDCWTGQER